MVGAGNTYSERSNPDPKRQMSHFFPFMDAIFESSDIYVSFGIPLEVRKLERGHGR